MKRFLTSLGGASLFVFLVGAVLVASSAQAAFGLKEFNIDFRQQSGAPATTAGSHPYAIETVFTLNYHDEVEVGSVPDQELKSLEVSLPVGFAGDPTAVPACSPADFLRRDPLTESVACPDNTAVGVVFPQSVHPGYGGRAPVFNLQHAPGVAAKLGFYASGLVPITIDLTVSKSAPYRVLAAVSNTPQAVRVFGAKLIIWGDPADPVHDEERGACGIQNGPSTICTFEGALNRPFLTLPRACAPPLFGSYLATSWQDPTDTPVTGESVTPLVLSGCEALGFDPMIETKPTTAAGESPSGLDFNLNVDDPGLTTTSGTADSDIKKAVVTLPEGMTTNPAVASGLGACRLSEYESEDLESTPGSGCPESSRLGQVDVETPLLEGTVLRGAIYVAKQHDNPFDNLLTIYIVIKDPELGILIKLPGKVEPNEATGRLTTVFDELPQLPFSHFHFQFRPGSRAPLITPVTCGTQVVGADLYPYSNPTVPLHDTASFSIDGSCSSGSNQQPNRPAFSAGTLSQSAGAYSPFVLSLSREDGSQQFASISTTLPEGLLGKLAGIPYCSSAGIQQASARGAEGQGANEIEHPSCPQASAVGTVTVGAGAGPEPLYVTGHAYLAGPYNGAPLSLEIITPAIAGPFDLGVVAVRTALHVDPLTAQITAQSDPIPTILHGLPLDIRSISLQMNRSNFTLNPTSCEPKSITGSALSAIGNTASLSQYFQVSACSALKFRPKLALSLKGQTKRVGHPAVKAVLTVPKSGAYSNIARAQVNLPHGEFIDQGNLNKTCTKPLLLAGQCPAKSIYGRAKAWTPLLEEPVEGPVYLVGGFGYKLPALVAELDGQIRVLLAGRVDTGPNKGIRSTFEAIPDAPVERFELSLKGGPKYSLLENSENLCARPQRAIARFTAQNGLVDHSNPVISVDCGKKKKTKKSAK